MTKIIGTLFVNRIHNENPLTKENLLKMYEQIESITEKILPGEKINTVAYGCTSGTIAIGEDRVKEKIQLVKPDCYVTTPITSAIKAFKKMNVKKIAVFTPYPESVNKTIFEYLNKKSINIKSFSTFNSLKVFHILLLKICIQLILWCPKLKFDY